MRVVSENSEKDIEALNAKSEAERVEHDLGFTLREMAANILRVVRGAGKPYEIAEQMQGCLAAYDHYRSVFGHFPQTDLILRMLRPDQAWPDDPPPGSNRTHTELDVPGQLVEGKREEQDAMRRAALQITASMLVGQLTQQRRGETDLVDALRAYESLQKELHAYRAAERAAAKKPKPPVSKKPAKTIKL